MTGFYYDSTIILMIPAIILSLYAQMRVKSAFAKYLGVPSVKRYTGEAVARRILDFNGLNDVRVEMTNGRLSDHYDPRGRVIRLSPEVFSGTSIASVSVAAHEAGHALQHGTGYAFLSFRSAFAPVAGFASTLAFPIILLGMFIATMPFLFDIGIVLFSAAVLFQLITLPVEFNASSRAISLMSEYGVITEDEIKPSKKVLSAAALTYVAAAASAVLQLLRLIILRGRR